LISVESVLVVVPGAGAVTPGEMPYVMDAIGAAMKLAVASKLVPAKLGGWLESLR
jgi:hypothetical protein